MSAPGSADLAVLIAGMHRSGTSAVANALREIGLSPGNEGELMPATVENPTGYWESTEVMKFNDRLLATLGWAWDAPGATALEAPVARPVEVAEGRQLVADHIAGSGTFFIKDPRLSLLMPWWRQILLDRFVTVVVLRSPEEVAWSLSVRNGMPPGAGMALWSAYYRHLATGLAGMPVVIVEYENLIADPSGGVARLIRQLAALGISGLGNGSSGADAIRPLLRRATHPPADDDGDDAAVALREVYERWRQLAAEPVERFSLEPHRVLPWEAAILDLQRVGKQRQAELKLAKGALAEQRATVDQQRSTLEQQRATLEQQRATIEQQRATLEQQRATLEQQRATLAEQRATVEKQTASLEQQRASLEQHRATLAEQRATLEQQRSTIEQQRATLEQQRATLAEQRTTIDELRATIDEQRATIKQQRIALEQQRAALDEHRARLERAVETEANLRSTVDVLVARSSAADSEAQARKDELARLSQRLGLISQHAEALSHALSMAQRNPLKRLLARFRDAWRGLAAAVGPASPNPLLDEEWYLAQYPDVRERRVSAQRHYRVEGVREGRDPNPLFDTDWYLSAYPDVAAKRLNPLDHYLRFGGFEGRDPSPLFDSDWYLEQYPDVAVSRVNPLLHYLEHGRREGRLPAPPPPPSVGGGSRPADTGSADVAGATVSAPASPEDAPATPERHVEEPGEDADRSRLQAFLDSPDRLVFPTHEAPAATVVIPTYGQAHLTYAALRALLATADEASFELVIVDNASPDGTRDLLARLDNVKVILNDENTGFGRACSAGARSGSADSICFLNSDTVVQPGWLSALLATLEQYPRCGAVGSKLIYPDGRLQEAGSILWQDGSGLAYGRGQDAADPAYNYVREVDYCSAAALLVRRDAFEAVGGFDPRYAPAYYEDVDLCLALSAAGYSIVYQPRSVVVHLEYGSSGAERAVDLQLRNRTLLVEKWQETVAERHPPSPGAVLRARDRRTGRRILVVDDRVPVSTLGSGYPRTQALLRALVEAGYVVSYLALHDTARVDPDVDHLEQLGIEVLYGAGAVMPVVAERAGLYEAAIVSRPHNAPAIAAIRRASASTAIVYDAEAIFVLRDVLLAAVAGEALTEAEVREKVAEEVGRASDADAIIAVTGTEARHFSRTYSGKPVLVWGTAVDALRDTPGHDARSGLLFIGNLSTPPNADAMTHFLTTAFQPINAALDCQLTIVGAAPTPALVATATRYSWAVEFAGAVSDTRPYYDRARVFVAPHRFAAGLPLKVVEAMANGVPCVVSPLLADQLEITDGVHALVASTAHEFTQRIVELYADAERWTSVQQAALVFVEQRFGRRQAVETLRAAVEGAIDARAGSRLTAAEPVTT